MQSLPDGSVDLILTDPPYNLGQFTKERGSCLETMRPNFFAAAGWDDLDFDTWSAFMDSMFAECSRVAKVGSAMIVFMSIIRVETIIQLATQHGFYYKTTGIWHKTNPMPRNMNLHFINSTEPWIYFVYKKRTGTFNNDGKATHDFIETPVAPPGEKRFGKHPTQKPVALMERFVALLSNPGDIVVDPFMGSGSSGVAAVLNGRVFYGADINQEYCRIAEERLKEVILFPT